MKRFLVFLCSLGIAASALGDSYSLVPPSGGGSGDMVSTNNLNDVANKSTSRINLGVAIGTNVEAFDADLDYLATFTPSANVKTILNAADNAAIKTALALTIGTNVEAWDADLDYLAGFTPTANVKTILNAADFAAVRTALGLVIGTNVEAWDTDLDTWAAITRASGFDTFATTPSSANLATLLTDENGSGKAIFAAGTLAITTGKTATVGNTLTFAGTDGTTMTFPATNATIARTDSGNTFAAGSTSVAPETLTAGSNLTSAAAGAREYDSTDNLLYFTQSTTEGRGTIPAKQRFYLAADGSNITSTAANFFGTASAITLVANARYIIRAHLYFTKTTSAAVVWSLVNQNAYTNLTGLITLSNATGDGAAGNAAATYPVSKTLATGLFSATSSLTGTPVNHVHELWADFEMGTGGKVEIQCSTASGSVTPLKGSYFEIERIGTSNTGTFATNF